MAPLISIIGKYAYPEALETLLYRAFSKLDVDVTPYPEPEADLSLCVKISEPPEEAGGTTALLMTDNVQRFPDAPRYAENFDQTFAIHGDIPGAHQINCGYDPLIHRPYGYQVSGNRKPVFIGTAHPCRSWLTEIQDLEIYGNDWSKYGTHTGPVYGEPKRMIYAIAKASVNQTYPGDLHNMRFYEALRMGPNTPLITDKWPQNEEWKPGKHFLTYDGTQKDLKNVLENLNQHNLKKIAKNGHNAAKPHTYTARAQEIMKTPGLLTQKDK